MMHKQINEKVIVYNIWTHQAKQYANARKACQQLDLSYTNIYNFLAHKNHKVLMKQTYMIFYKYEWNYLMFKRQFLIMKHEKRIPKRLIGINIRTGVKLYFNSMNEAEKLLGFPHQGIGLVLSGKQVSTHGYTFKWDKQSGLLHYLPRVIVD